MLFLTDRPRQSHRIHRDLHLVGHCDIISLLDFSKGIGAGQVVVSDVSLKTETDVAALREKLANYRDAKTALLCLLRQNTRREVVQACAAGAAATLSCGCIRSIPIKTVFGLLEGGDDPRGLSCTMICAIER